MSFVFVPQATLAAVKMILIFFVTFPLWGKVKAFSNFLV